MKLNYNFFPYMAKGRWYAFELSSDGTDHTIEKGDLVGTISGDFVKLPAGYHIIDQKADVTFIPDAAAATYSFGLKNYADGTQAFPIPAAAKYSKAVIWVFANYEPT